MSDTLDLFALARQDYPELRLDELELLQLYRSLPGSKREALVKIAAWSARVEQGEGGADLLAEPAKPEQPELSQADRARLRRACVELAAEYRAPLPAGDERLIAAIERWRRLKPRNNFEALLGIEYTFKDEREIIEPISIAAQSWIENLIEDWPVQGLCGAAAKLRYLHDCDFIDLTEPEAEQLIEVIEREAGRAAP